jgi:Dolichyl-phosphate-mannose-protein mannosyltransferase
MEPAFRQDARDRQTVPMSQGRFLAAAAAIVLVAATLRFWGLQVGLPHLMARPDDEVILAQVEKVALGGPDLGWAIYPSAYIYLCTAWSWGASTIGSHLGLLPSGGLGTLGRQQPQQLLLVIRVLSATLSTITVAFLIAAVRPALGCRAALIAGTLLATSFLHARDSHSAKPEAALTLGVVLALWACLPLARRATAARGAAAGLAVGFGAAMKYPGLLLGLPVYAAGILGSTTRGWRRLLPRPVIVAGLCAAVFFVATSPYLFINPASRYGMLEIVSFVFPRLRPPGVVPPFPLTGPVGPGVTGFRYHAAFSLWYGTGAIQTVLVPIALLWALWSRRTLPLLCALFAIAWYLMIAASSALLARYLTPVVPALAVMLAGMLVALATRILGPQRAAIPLALATAMLAEQPFAANIQHDRLAARTDTRVLATEWMAKNLPRGSRVAVLGTRFWLWGVPQFPSGVTPVNVEPTSAGLARERVGYVLTHDHELFSSHLDPSEMTALAPHLRLLADLDPAVPGRADAIFESADAYYIPFAHFGAVTRPGPHVRIYAVADP